MKTTAPVCVYSESTAVSGHLTYVLADYSFLFNYAMEVVPSRAIWPGGLATLCYGHLEVDLHLSNGQLLGAGSYTSFSMWDRKPLKNPRPTISSGLLVKNYKTAQRGVGYPIAGMQFENQSFDPDSGWYCCGNPNALGDDVVAFATDCLAVLADERIQAICLHPENWSNVATALGKSPHLSPH